MGIPPSCSELPAPANQLSIQSEVLCDPEDWVGCTAELERTEFAIVSSCIATKSKSSLTPRICPQDLFVVVNFFIWEGLLIYIIVFETTCGFIEMETARVQCEKLYRLLNKANFLQLQTLNFYRESI